MGMGMTYDKKPADWNGNRMLVWDWGECGPWNPFPPLTSTA